jgi:FKBP-type peptidyl-prolyl cis-trans isomerase 2
MKIEKNTAVTLPFRVALQLKAEDAFGLRDESLLRSLPKTQFLPSVKETASTTKTRPHP